jgi:hypothetical protein
VLELPLYIIARITKYSIPAKSIEKPIEKPVERLVEKLVGGLVERPVEVLDKEEEEEDKGSKLNYYIFIDYSIYKNSKLLDNCDRFSSKY